MFQVCILLGQQSLDTKNCVLLDWSSILLELKYSCQSSTNNFLTFDSSRWLCFDRLTRHMLLYQQYDWIDAFKWQRVIDRDLDQLAEIKEERRWDKSLIQSQGTVRMQTICNSTWNYKNLHVSIFRLYNTNDRHF